jgi:hypothetical protein
VADSIDAEHLSERVHGVIADEMAAGSCFVQAFVAMVSYVNADGDRAWAILAPSDQFFDTTLGLTDQLHAWHKEVQRLVIQEALMSDDVDDD